MSEQHRKVHPKLLSLLSKDMTIYLPTLKVSLRPSSSSVVLPEDHQLATTTSPPPLEAPEQWLADQHTAVYRSFISQSLVDRLHLVTFPDREYPEREVVRVVLTAEGNTTPELELLVVPFTPWKIEAPNRLVRSLRLVMEQKKRVFCCFKKKEVKVPEYLEITQADKYPLKVQIDIILGQQYYIQHFLPLMHQQKLKMPTDDLAFTWTGKYGWITSGCIRKEPHLLISGIVDTEHQPLAHQYDQEDALNWAAKKSYLAWLNVVFLLLVTLLLGNIFLLVVFYPSYQTFFNLNITISLFAIFTIWAAMALISMTFKQYRRIPIPLLALYKIGHKIKGIPIQVPEYNEDLEQGVQVEIIQMDKEVEVQVGEPGEPQGKGCSWLPQMPKIFWIHRVPSPTPSPGTHPNQPFSEEAIEAKSKNTNEQSVIRLEDSEMEPDPESLDLYQLRAGIGEPPSAIRNAVLYPTRARFRPVVRASIQSLDLKDPPVPVRVLLNPLMYRSFLNINTIDTLRQMQTNWILKCTAGTKYSYSSIFWLHHSSGGDTAGGGGGENLPAPTKVELPVVVFGERAPPPPNSLRKEIYRKYKVLLSDYHDEKAASTDVDIIIGQDLMTRLFTLPGSLVVPSKLTGLDSALLQETRFGWTLAGFSEAIEYKRENWIREDGGDGGNGRH